MHGDSSGSVSYRHSSFLRRECTKLSAGCGIRATVSLMSNRRVDVAPSPRRLATPFVVVAVVDVLFTIAVVVLALLTFKIDLWAWALVWALASFVVRLAATAFTLTQVSAGQRPRVIVPIAAAVLSLVVVVGAVSSVQIPPGTSSADVQLLNVLAMASLVAPVVWCVANVLTIAWVRRRSLDRTPVLPY